jgi:hypothetical protein
MTVECVLVWDRGLVMIRAPLPVVPDGVTPGAGSGGASEALVERPSTVPEIKVSTLFELRKFRGKILDLCMHGDEEACITLGVYDRLIRSVVLDQDKEFKRMHPRPQVPATSPTRPAPRSRAEGG